MEQKFIEEKITYTGRELAPHWIYKNFNILSDAVVSFCGPADVKISEMVDVEDVIKNSPIYSENMLHFIAEHFNINLIEGVFRQRLLVVLAKEEIEKQTNLKVDRFGDDLFFGNKKLSVSIAACSHNSVLIHFAMNIISKNAAVDASGLSSELGIKNIKSLAQNILQNYSNEITEIINASCKVKGV